MTDRTQLARLLDNTAKELRLRFDSSGVMSGHPGAKGSIREELVANFLREHLPRRFEVYGSAELLTADGEISSQCDVVIADASTPPFFSASSHRVVPNECVYGVIEVKSHLDKQELESACEKFAKIRALAKTAYHRTPVDAPYAVPAYGRLWQAWPTSCAIFAFGGSNIDTLARNLMDWCGPRPVEHWPDCVWVLGEGYLAWSPPDVKRLDYFPESGSGVVALKPLPGQDVLLPMTLSLHAMLAGATMPRFNLRGYAGNSTLGTVIAQYQWQADDEALA